MPMTISKKLEMLRCAGCHWFFWNEVVDPEVVKKVAAVKKSITDKILKEMDNPNRHFRLPSPHNEELSPIVIDELDALIHEIGWDWLLK